MKEMSHQVSHDVPNIITGDTETKYVNFSKTNCKCGPVLELNLSLQRLGPFHCTCWSWCNDVGIGRERGWLGENSALAVLSEWSICRQTLPAGLQVPPACFEDDVLFLPTSHQLHGYTLTHPLPGALWLRESKQMTSCWPIWKFLLCVLVVSLTILIKQETHPNISKISPNFPKNPLLPPDPPPLLTSRKLIINTLAFLSYLVRVL